jgi:hypothetical protein
MSTEHFDNWAENYKESILEELGEYKGQEHLDMLTTEALHDIYNEQQVQIKNHQAFLDIREAVRRHDKGG